MGQVVYHVATTLDNFIADVHGNANESVFLYEGDHVPDFINHINQYDIVLMGSKTYAYGFQYGLKPGEPGYKGIKHYVFSKSMNFESNEEVTLVKDDPVPFIRNLKQTTDKKIWLCGGGELAGTLLDHALLDLLVLKINPVMIGQGISLFGNSKKHINLKLLDLKKYESGVILPTYQIMYGSA